MEQPTCVSTAAFSLRSQTRLLAGLQLVKTFVIMLLIVGGSVAFNADAQVYVIGPIERMMALVEKLSENPLGATHLDLTYDDDKKVRDQGYETVLLEQTLERVGELLQVGFGAAGAEIIGKNMAVHSSLNPMVPGKKITAIYGFCDIRRFTDTTECLQEDVMAYVNRLGSLVHGSAHSFFGAANKNVGDAFLVSWKLCDGELPGFSSFDDQASEEQRLKANSLVKCSIGKGRKVTPSQLADAAICSFLRCQLDLEEANREGELREYSTRPSVQQRFGQDFAVKMGFGMHVGWAVEGAIGSSLKIDATYLSPHVEMSDRLEAYDPYYFRGFCTHPSGLRGCRASRLRSWRGASMASSGSTPSSRRVVAASIASSESHAIRRRRRRRSRRDATAVRVSKKDTAQPPCPP